MNGNTVFCLLVSIASLTSCSENTDSDSYVWCMVLNKMLIYKILQENTYTAAETFWQFYLIVLLLFIYSYFIYKKLSCIPAGHKTTAKDVKDLVENHWIILATAWEKNSVMWQLVYKKKIYKIFKTICPNLFNLVSSFSIRINIALKLATTTVTIVLSFPLCTTFNTRKPLPGMTDIVKFTRNFRHVLIYYTSGVNTIRMWKSYSQMHVDVHVFMHEFIFGICNSGFITNSHSSTTNTVQVVAYHKLEQHS